MTDLTVHIEENKKLLNCRVSAIIVRDDKVLFERQSEDEFYFLPGGRIEYFTSSLDSLERELEEELNITEFEAQLAITYETFFKDWKGMQVQEFGYMYKVDIAAEQYIPESIIEDGRKITFEWISISDFENTKLRPPFLKDLKQYLDGHVHHIIVAEDSVKEAM